MYFKLYFSNINNTIFDLVYAVYISNCFWDYESNVIYIFLFLVILFFIALKLDSPFLERYLYIFLGVILILFAGLRGVGVDRDSVGYSRLFSYFVNYSDWLSSSYEPMMVFIPVTLRSLGMLSDSVIFFSFACFGCGFKLAGIYKYSEYKLLSTLLYFSNLFLLQEMTQIRAGVAVGILIFTIDEVINRNKWRFIFIVFFASIFHYSALIFLPAYFISCKKINKRVYLFSLLLVVVLSYFKVLNIFQLIPGIGSFNTRLAAYQYAANLGRSLDVNIFNIFSVVNLCVILVILVKVDKLNDAGNITVILIKFYYFSIFLFYAFSSVPVLSSRLSEIFNIFGVFAVPYLIKLSKNKFNGYALVVIIAFIILCNNIFKQEILTTYYSNLFL